MSDFTEKAIAGIGAKFYRYSTDSSSYIEVAKISEIGGPNKSRDTIEVTTLGSVDGYKEFISGLRDGGQVTLSLLYTKSGYQNINADFENDLNQAYLIVLPDEDNFSFEFEGLVTELGLTVSTGDAIACDTTIKVSGKIEVFEGSSGALN